jgi:hypothetical protein
MGRDADTLFFRVTTWLNRNAHWLGLAWLLLVTPFFVAYLMGRL